MAGVKQGANGAPRHMTAEESYFTFQGVTVEEHPDEVSPFLKVNEIANSKRGNGACDVKFAPVYLLPPISEANRRAFWPLFGRLSECLQ